MSSVRYKPIMGRVLIKRDKIEKTKSGVYIGDPKPLNTGIVIAIGDAVEHPDIVVGAHVHWGKNAGAMIQPEYLHDGKLHNEVDEYFICMEEDILGVIEPKKE